MSEPVKSAEIEDVLSSIRRLVSENHRQKPERKAEEEKAGQGRLVLTEALRVAEPVEETIAEEAQAEDDAQDATVAVPEDPVDEVVDWSEDAPAASNDEAHTEDAHENDANADGVMHHDAQPDYPEEGASGEAETSVEEEDHGWEDDAPVESSSDPDEQEVSEVEAVFSSVREDGPIEAADQRTDDAGVSKEADKEAPWQDPDATLYEAAGLADAPQTDSADTEPSEGDARPLGQKIADLEKVIARSTEEWEPDDPGVDDYAGSDIDTFVWEDAEVQRGVDAATDAADAEVARDAVTDDAPAPEPERADPLVPPPVKAPATDQTVETASDLDLDETLIDEAALRELVADIVREELQGALGERITRNVRKLVRREIHRALTVQDLD